MSEIYKNIQIENIHAQSMTAEIDCLIWNFLLSEENCRIWSCDVDNNQFMYSAVNEFCILVASDMCFSH